jgi:hypothetical protein
LLKTFFTSVTLSIQETTKEKTLCTCFYRTGYEAALKHPGKKFEEIEDDLVLDYEKSEPGSALPWDHARHAVQAAWAKLSNEVTPLDPSRGVRTGF